MAQVKNTFSPDQFEYSRLLSILNQAKIKTGDNPGYEVIKQLIKGNENWSQFSQLTYPSLLFSGTDINWGALIAELEAIITAILIASVWTKDDESASLADSRMVIAGTGITLNYGTPNQVTISSSGGSGGQSSGMMALDGDQGEEAFPIPGPRGEAGPAGATGHSTLGFLFLDGDQGDEGYAIPGLVGPIGATGAAGSGGALGYNFYSPAGQTILSTTSSTMADVDAANMAVTFTAPASGNVLVRLTSYGDISSNAFQYRWGIREDSTDLANSGGVIMRNSDGLILSYAYAITGIAAGAHTYKWAHSVNGGTGRIIVHNGQANFPGAMMEVFALP